MLASELRKCPICQSGLFVDERICPDCLEPEDHDD